MNPGQIRYVPTPDPDADLGELQAGFRPGRSERGRADGSYRRRV